MSGRQLYRALPPYPRGFELLPRGGNPLGLAAERE
jgi:hypothetical protein